MKLRPLGKKKGQLNLLAPAAIALVVLTIVVAMGVLILVGMNASTTNAGANTVITKGITGVSTFADWFQTIAIVVIGAVIIGIIVGFFAMRSRGGGGRM